jgi:hypothetical protein
LGEAEEKCQIAVDAFLLKNLRSSNALPGAGDLDQDAFARHALLLIERDELACLGDRRRGIKAQAGGDLRGYAARDHFENLTSEQDEKPIDELSRHFFVASSAFLGKFRRLFH